MIASQLRLQLTVTATLTVTVTVLQVLLLTCFSLMIRYSKCICIVYSIQYLLLFVSTCTTYNKLTIPFLDFTVLSHCWSVCLYMFRRLACHAFFKPRTCCSFTDPMYDTTKKTSVSSDAGATPIKIIILIIIIPWYMRWYNVRTLLYWISSQSTPTTSTTYSWNIICCMDPPP